VEQFAPEILTAPVRKKAKEKISRTPESTATGEERQAEPWNRQQEEGR
jgi:hypothetical protein